jgi:ribosomal protein S18 acetylase RimI-like enzyme
VIREVRVSGLDYLALATALLQRARLADPESGLWEAADLQWWWRMPRRSDEVKQLFWVDDAGPVATVVLTDWDRVWGCDPILVPSAANSLLPKVWARTLKMIDALELHEVEVLVRDDDAESTRLADDAGFVATEDRSGICWLRAGDRPKVSSLSDGFVLADRVGALAEPHPLQRRNGPTVETRLRQCSLYDPALDLSVRSPDGRIAGYSLFWLDPVTHVGLLEPMRVEDEFQRRGIARAMLTAGLERLARRGADRFKVGYATDAARALYVDAGFRVTSTSRAYRWSARAGGTQVDS